MADLDLFNNPEVQEAAQEPVIEQGLEFFRFNPTAGTTSPIQEEDSDVILNVKEKHSEPYSTPIATNPVYFGKSFEYAGFWTPGKMYYNDSHRVTFVTYNNYLLACNTTHESSRELEPVILYKDETAVGVENIYWSLVLSGEVGMDAAVIQNSIATLKKLVKNNTDSIATNKSALSVLGKHTNNILDNIDKINAKNTQTDKEIEKINATLKANIAYPWIGTEDEYDALPEKDLDKFYFVYEA